MMPAKQILLCFLLAYSTIKSVNSISCYQCSGTDSDNPFECNEFLESNTGLDPLDCANIHDAQYCIKHVGRNGGVAIDCYQCNSSSTMECGDGLMNLDGGVLKPTSCEHVFNAQYCIKHTGVAIDCYQCNSSSTMECGDGLMNLDGGVLKPTSCEHVFNAQYCIKHTGGISTMRYCSSLDLGNYCNYVQQAGDKLEYRTCIYTCSSDGCNSATTMKISAILLLVTFLVTKF